MVIQDMLMQVKILSVRLFSALTINCINSIETFTNDEFLLDTDEEAGLIRLIFSYNLAVNQNC